MIKIERQKRREREERRREKKKNGLGGGWGRRIASATTSEQRREENGSAASETAPAALLASFPFFFFPFSFFSFSFFFLFFIVTITDRHVQLYINEISNPPRCTTRTSAVGSTGTIILFEARVFYAAACQVVQSRRAKQRTGEHGLGKDRVHATLRGGTRPLLGHLPVRRLRVLHRESG